MIRSVKLAALLGSALALGACRGAPSDKPPLYVFPDMDWQEKIQGQEAAPLKGSQPFWADGRGNRKPVDGTVARGHLNEDDAYFKGQVGDQFRPLPRVGRGERPPGQVAEGRPRGGDGVGHGGYRRAGGRESPGGQPAKEKLQ